MGIEQQQKRSEDIESEQLYHGNNDGIITEPLNPKDIDIVSQPMVIANIVENLKDGVLILEPDVQQISDLWDKQKQSRLIESLIIGIPLPTFYFDAGNDAKWIVVDGLQRLFAIKQFMALEKDDPQRLFLMGLEYLTEYNGYSFEMLPSTIQKRIKSQVINVYIIRAGTPDKVRISIFTRMNTGGLILSPAEIKHSVYRGQATDLLKELAHSEEFTQATRGTIESSRMLDCEFVNRFLAFYFLGLEAYTGNLEEFLNDVMVHLKNESRDVLERCRKDFLKAMKYARIIFGDGAFRKIQGNKKCEGMKQTDGKFGRINKPLYDAVAVNLAKLDEQDCEKLVKKKEKLMKKYIALLQNDLFIDGITKGTAKIQNVYARHREINKIFQEVLADD